MGMNGRLTTVVMKPSDRRSTLDDLQSTAPIGADRPIGAAHDEGATGDKNVLKGISTIKADLKDTTVEAQIGIHVRCFKVEVVSKGQLR